MTIKHLVISGGGPTMVKSLGACQYLEENQFWKIDDIVSIHGTSAGAIVGVMLCLRYDWETLSKYLIERPWHEAFPFSIKSILDAYTNRGIFGKNVSEIFFKSLLLGKDLSIDITLKEFYEYSKIELYMYTFEINQFKMEIISHKTYPELPLLTAIQMTSAIPVIISPVFTDGKCFIDGGIASNYPLNFCLEMFPNKSEILGFRNYYGETRREEKKINEDSTLLDYIMIFLYKLIFQLNVENKQKDTVNEVLYKAQYLSIEYIKSVLLSAEIRRDFFEEGIEAAKMFLEGTIEQNSKIAQESLS
jgi:predicted acylesterase/phospholipase RssA